MISNIEDLVAFLHEFHAPWGEHRPSPDIPDNLPRALTILYAEFGNLIDMDPHDPRIPFATQDGLMPANRLQYIDGMCEFAWENQGNWSCRFPIDGDDPPVFSNSRDVWEEGPPKGFVQACDSLEHFLITLCLQEAVMSCPKLIACNGQDVGSIFRSPPIPLWMDGIYVDGEPSHDFYMYEGSKMLIMNCGTVWVGSHADDIEPQFANSTKFSTISDY
ncbi:hypothetical protein GCM10023155_30680 [Bremerella cremea]